VWTCRLREFRTVAFTSATTTGKPALRVIGRHLQGVLVCGAGGAGVKTVPVFRVESGTAVRVG